MEQLNRSNLYIPADNEKFINNINNLNADMYTLDLEDSVHIDKKKIARENISKNNFYDKNVYVRVNNINTELFDLDLEYAIKGNVKGICYPKCTNLYEFLNVQNKLMNLAEDGTNLKLQILVENPMLLLKLDHILERSMIVSTLVFGIVDFCNSMKINLNYQSVLTARSMIAYYAKVYGLKIIDCPYINYDNMFNFEKDCETSKNLGYDGRIVIHPAQINIANTVYSDNKDIMYFKNIVNTYEYGLEQGLSSVSYNGIMIAKAVYVNAKNIVDRFNKENKENVKC